MTTAMELTKLQTTRCFKCGIDKKVISAMPTARMTVYSLECGHTACMVPSLDVETPRHAHVERKEPLPLPKVENKPVEAPKRPERDSVWNDLYPFQRRGVEFFEDAILSPLYGKAINEDDMGSGKTIQTAAFLRYHPELFPVLIVPPPPLTYMWQRAMKTWFNSKREFNNSDYAPLIWNNPHGNLLEDQQVFIVSSGMIAKPGLSKALVTYGFKTVIIDEGHYYKHDDSQRTKIFKELTKLIPHSIILTGTPVENRLGEYYNILHATNPRHWYDRNRLLSYCQYVDGKPLGLSEYRRDEFFAKVKPYVIRRTKAEILPDLPPKRINYEFFSLLDNANFVRTYNKSLDTLEEKLAEKREAANNSTDIIAIMSHLRHLVGIAKVPLVVEQVKQFLDEVPDEKVTIGAYHEIVHEQLAELLAEYEPITFFRKSAEEKFKLEQEFRENPKRRLLIASIAADREGRNLQFCPNAWVAERDWNDSREDQFRNRFHRIGSEKFVQKGGSINISYAMAGETIDEYFHEMVTLKSHISDSAVNEEFSVSGETIRDIAKRMVVKRLKFVG